VTFTITVMNQGAVDASVVEVTDYIPADMTLNDSDWTDNLDGTATIALGALAAGGMTTVDITLTVSASFTSGVITNWAEISEDGPETDIDSDPDGDNFDSDEETDDLDDDDVVDEDGKNGGDEDDHDPAVVTITEEPIFDLALIKQLASGQADLVRPGSLVTFTITVFNQGGVPAQNVLITDYLPTGLSLFDSDWAAGSGNTATITLPGPITPGGRATVDITVEVSSTFTGTAVNFAEITDAEDPDGSHPVDIDSTPDSMDDNDGPVTDDAVDNTNGDEDDHDPAEIRSEIFDLALLKTLATGQDALISIGDQVTFTITVINQGTLDANDVVVTDYIPAGMTLADSDWTGSGATASITLAGILPAGGQREVDITLTVNAAGDLVNFAEISEDNSPIDDIDSIPDPNPSNDGLVKDDEVNGLNGDEDDHDPATVTVTGEGVFDLALKKELALGQDATVAQGDLVTFTITVYNQGNVDAYDIQVIDYIPAGLKLADSSWTPVGATKALQVIDGPILAGGSLAVNIILEVVDGAGDLVNYAEIGFATDTPGGAIRQDIDSIPDDVQDNESGVVNDNVVNNENGDEDDHDPAGIRVEVVSLGDYVWYDNNIDGIQDSNEAGVSGVTVYLLDASGTRVPGRVTTTDSTGYYSFDGLPLGTYSVEFDLATLPENFVVTLQNAGGDDAADSDANPTTGITHSTLLNIDGMRDPTLDLGIYQLGNVDGVIWIDYDNDGEPTEEMLSIVGLSNIRVRLFEMVNGTKSFLRELTTGPTGEFCFMGVPSGTYVVEYLFEDLPAMTPTLVNGATPMSYEFTLEAGESNKLNNFAVIPVPTAIELQSFDATVIDGGVQLTWTTASETDSLGFEIWSGSAEAPMEKVSDLIFAANSLSGESYSFTHQGATSGTYWLREISLDLSVADYGPAGTANSSEPVLASFDVDEAGIYHLNQSDASGLGVFQGTQQLATHVLEDGIVFYVPVAGEVDVKTTTEPLHMVYQSAAPREDVPLAVLVAENGKAEFQTDVDGNLLVDGLIANPIVLDITDPTKPIALESAILGDVDSTGLYLYSHKDRSLKVQSYE